MNNNKLFAALLAAATGLGAAAVDMRPAAAGPLHIPVIGAPAAGAPAPAATQIQYRHHRGPGRHHSRGHGNWGPPAAFALGAIIGGAIAAAPPPYYGPPVYGGPVYRGPVYREPAYRGPVYRRHVNRGSAHVSWCYDRYRSYRAWDNTFQPYHGPRRQCWSPYS